LFNGSQSYGNFTYPKNFCGTGNDLNGQKEDPRDDPFVAGNGNLYGQSYRKLVKQSRKESIRFKDPIFLPDNRSISLFKDPPRDLKWMHLLELSANAELFQAGSSSFDVHRGELGNSWMAAALSSLAMKPKQLEKVCPKNQSVHKESNAGVFKFR